MHTKIDGIRPAQLRDAEALAKFARRAFCDAFEHLYMPDDLSEFLSETRTASNYAHFIKSPAHILLISQNPDGQIVGYVLCGPMDLPVADRPPNARELKQLYISQDLQSSGIGTKLLLNAIEWARYVNAQTLYLGVYAENLGAQRFYYRAGFKKVGAYWFRVGAHLDHEVIMGLELN